MAGESRIIKMRARRVITLWEMGATAREIAHVLGMAQRSVNQIINRGTHKDATPVNVVRTVEAAKKFAANMSPFGMMISILVLRDKINRQRSSDGSTKVS